MTSVAVRRALALLTDLAAPIAVGVIAYWLAWLWLRPDLVDGLAALGPALLGLAIGAAAWVAAIVALDVLLPLARHCTLGDRLCSFRLRLPGSAGRRLGGLLVHALLRAMVVIACLYAFGYTLGFLGPGVLGFLASFAVAATVLFAVTVVGLRGAATLLDQIGGIDVDDVSRPR